MKCDYLTISLSLIFDNSLHLYCQKMSVITCMSPFERYVLLIMCTTCSISLVNKNDLLEYFVKQVYKGKAFFQYILIENIISEWRLINFNYIFLWVNVHLLSASEFAKK